MEENTTVYENTSEEVVETVEESSPVDVEPDVLDDVPESMENTSDDSEIVESTENDFIEESSEVPTEETTVESTEDVEELTEETTEELTVESTDVMLYLTEQETEVPFFEKPFTDYSVSEGLLLLIFILLFVWFIRDILFD